MYDYSKFRTIVNSLKPTFENATREFIISTMKKYLQYLYNLIMF